VPRSRSCCVMVIAASSRHDTALAAVVFNPGQVKAISMTMSTI